MTRELTADQREALTILQEECAEVIHAASKVLRHGPESQHPDGGPINEENLNRELVQVLTMVSVCYASGLFLDVDDYIDAIAKSKVESLRKYSKISVELLDQLNV